MHDFLTVVMVKDGIFVRMEISLFETVLDVPASKVLLEKSINLLCILIISVSTWIISICSHYLIGRIHPQEWLDFIAENKENTMSFNVNNGNKESKANEIAIGFYIVVEDII